MPHTPVTTSQDDLQKVREDALSRIDSLPSLSTVVSEFLELSGREYFTARDFERVIVKDQALVARLLKVANSSKFSGSRTIKTIPEAIVLVGMDNMKNMVYAVSTGGLTKFELNSYSYPGKGFWLHAMGVGMTCRAITEVARDGEISNEEAFVAGLLHDVAKLIIDDFLDPAAGPRLVAIEEESLSCGINHAELAEHILESWKIPEQIAAAVRYHHNPDNGGQWCKGAALVSLADAICNIWGVGTQALMDLGEDIEPASFSELLEVLGIPEDKLQPALLPLRQKLAKMEELYDED